MTGPDTTELLLASALMMVGDDPNAVIGLLLSATVKACLIAEHPRGALEMAELAFAEAPGRRARHGRGRRSRGAIVIARDTTKEAAMASLT